MSAESDRLRVLMHAKYGQWPCQYISFYEKDWPFLDSLVVALEVAPPNAARRWRAHIAQSVAAGGWCPECGTQGKHIADCLIAPNEPSKEST